MSINHVTISGNLTRDPELRSSQGGMAILAFGVAVNERVKNQATGEWEDRPNFVDCVVFGKRAESLSRFLTKGSKVAVSGKLRYSAWGKDGQRRSKLEIIADEIDLMSQRQQREQHMAPAEAAAYMGATVRPAQAQGAPGLYDEDIPF